MLCNFPDILVRFWDHERLKIFERTFVREDVGADIPRNITLAGYTLESHIKHSKHSAKNQVIHGNGSVPKVIENRFRVREKYDLSLCFPPARQGILQQLGDLTEYKIDSYPFTSVFERYLPQLPQFPANVPSRYLMLKPYGMVSETELQKLFRLFMVSAALFILLLMLG